MRGHRMAARTEAPLVVHVSPTYFAPESVIGGGERYAEELSRAMSERVQVRFVSFGQRGFRDRVGERFERVVLRSWTKNKMTPFSPGLFHELRGARVVHCHQLHTLPTFLAVAFGRLQGSATYVSDLGGGGWTPGYQIDIGRWLSGHLPISAYAARGIPRGHRNAGIIYGGVDLERFPARAEMRHDGSVVFLGRILPHKGIHTLIDGLPPDRTLRVIGPVGDEVYLRRLMERAAGKRVEFIHGLSDAEVRDHLRSAAVLVHPTPTDAVGRGAANELLGLAVLEAMASNCPAIVTRAASLPEIVKDGESGFVVAPDNPVAIGAAIEKLMAEPALWTSLAVGARRRVEQLFTWSRAVERCFSAYGTSFTP
jgi:glycosyltransferase involved in cell wall biosynthesis